MKQGNRKRSVIGAIAALLVAVALGSAYAEEQLTDVEISNAIDDELMEDAATPAGYIDVSTDDGIVTLTGSVKNILAKDRAQAVAETVKGVRGVINRVQIEAPFRTDVEIQEDVQDALRWDPATESWEIITTVSDATVTLEGIVDSWQEKQLAAQVAKGVRGVEGINNQLDVTYQMERSDMEILEDIQGALRWDAYVDDALISVVVDDGNVNLSGTVGSLSEKRRAAADAWVAGVESVDDADLDVRWWARDDRLRKDKYISKSDEEIKDAVQDAFLYDPRVNMFEIEVEPDSGYVTLRGTVDNLKAKRAAAQDARSVVGVWSIDNKIKVRPGTPSDSRIERNVETALMWDPYVDRYEIDVEVADGEVYLYGDVDSFFEKAQADDASARQVGVVDVNNFLTVNELEPADYDPYVDDWYVYDYDWYVTTDFVPTQTDWEIEEDIRSELFWSPFVDQDEVNVDVDDGVATLTGTVDTWAERDVAGENAIEGGAILVNNDLTVDYGPLYYAP